MSTTTQEGKPKPSTTTSSGAYIPPHRRRRETAGQADRVETTTCSDSRGDNTRFHSSSSRRGGGGRQGQHVRDRRGYSNYDSRSFDNKQNHAPSQQQQQRHNHHRHQLAPVPDFEIPNTRICCINLPARTDKWQSVQMEARRVGGDAFCRQIKRFNAVDGRQWLQEVNANDDDDQNWMVQVEWDATQNAEWSHRVTPGLRTMTDGEVGCALSHVMLWKQLVNQVDNDATTNMLILEDDCTFCARGKQTRFPQAMEKTLQLLPEDWGILYLGFSARGPRQFVNDLNVDDTSDDPIRDPPIRLYQPTYGFHTHAYMITKVAAECLLESFPVKGPIDVWLADNQWFGIPTYCSVIANEGWYNEETEMYEGANLVGQKKWKLSSDVDQSAHT